MICRPRYYFRKELKDEFLRGMKLNYLCNKIEISYSYLSSIVQGRNVVDDCLIFDIMISIGYTPSEIKKLKDTYFMLREN